MNQSQVNRRSFLKWANYAGLASIPAISRFSIAETATKSSDTKKLSAKPSAQATPDSPNRILLKDYRPESIYKIPATHIAKAKFPVIDMHSHPYAKTEGEITDWLKNMDAAGIERTIILTMSTGTDFDDVNRKYSKYPDRFMMLRDTMLPDTTSPASSPTPPPN
jgi:hypothetical protein